MHAPLSRWILVSSMYWARLHVTYLQPFHIKGSCLLGVPLQTGKGGTSFQISDFCASDRIFRRSSHPLSVVPSHSIIAHSLSASSVATTRSPKQASSQGCQSELPEAISGLVRLSHLSVTWYLSITCSPRTKP